MKITSKLTFSQKSILYDLHLYSTKVPPVTTVSWTKKDWITFIDHWYTLPEGTTKLDVEDLSVDISKKPTRGFNFVYKEKPISPKNVVDSGVGSAYVNDVIYLCTISTYALG
jgi:hypothetical protein